MAQQTINIGAVTTPGSGKDNTGSAWQKVNANFTELYAATGGAGVSPNLVINGDFQINQRAFAGGALSAGAYGFDRWKADTGGANYTLSGYVLTLASGTVVQVVESAMCGVANLASTQVTVSVDTPSADLTVTFGSVSGTITAGSGRRGVTLTTGAGDTGNLSLKIAKASGSGVTFGRVKLEFGASATTWQARPSAVEQRLCQRYYYRREGASLWIGLGFFFTADLIVYEHRHPVDMRTAPTLTVTNVGNILATNAGVTLTGVTLVQDGGMAVSVRQQALLFTVTPASGSAGAGVQVQMDATTNGLLEFSAEL